MHMYDLAAKAKDMPTSLHAVAYDVACRHIEQNQPPTDSYLHPDIVLGEIVALSFFSIPNILELFPETEATRYASRFVELWPRAFAWARYLRCAVDYLHIQGMSNDYRDSCALIAKGILSFIKSSDKGKLLLSENVPVLDFVAEFWAIKSEIPEVMDSTASTMNCLSPQLIELGLLDSLLDKLQSVLGTARDVASHAMNIARIASLPIDDGGPSTASFVHCAVLSMLVALRPEHPSSRATLKAGVVPFALENLTRTLSTIEVRSAAERSNHYGMLECYLRIVTSGYQRPKDGRFWIRQGFKYGQLGSFFELSTHLEALQQVSQQFLIEMFSVSTLPYLHLGGVFRAARRDMIRFSEKINNTPFDIGRLPIKFREIWTKFETCLLEHHILRRMRALGEQDESVYCGNVRD